MFLSCTLNNSRHARPCIEKLERCPIHALKKSKDLQVRTEYSGDAPIVHWMNLEVPSPCTKQFWRCLSDTLNNSRASEPWAPQVVHCTKVKVPGSYTVYLSKLALYLLCSRGWAWKPIMIYFEKWLLLSLRTKRPFWSRGGTHSVANKLGSKNRRKVLRDCIYPLAEAMDSTQMLQASLKTTVSRRSYR